MRGNLVFLIIITFFSLSAFALHAYSPDGSADLNNGKYGEGQGVAPYSYSQNPVVQPVNSINSVFPTLNNINFVSGTNAALTMDKKNSQITFSCLASGSGGDLNQVDANAWFLKTDGTNVMFGDLNMNAQSIIMPYGSQITDGANNFIDPTFGRIGGDSWVALDWANAYLQDQATNAVSVDWNNRLLKNSLGATIIDWENYSYLTNTDINTQFVPYVGAINNVNLGDNNISTNGILVQGEAGTISTRTPNVFTVIGGDSFNYSGFPAADFLSQTGMGAGGSGNCKRGGNQTFVAGDAGDCDVGNTEIGGSLIYSSGDGGSISNAGVASNGGDINFFTGNGGNGGTYGNCGNGGDIRFLTGAGGIGTTCGTGSYGNIYFGGALGGDVNVGRDLNVSRNLKVKNDLFVSTIKSLDVGSTIFNYDGDEFNFGDITGYDLPLQLYSFGSVFMYDNGAQTVFLRDTNFVNIGFSGKIFGDGSSLTGISGLPADMNQAYYQQTDANNVFLKLTGGTLTGTLFGTDFNSSNDINSSRNLNVDQNLIIKKVLLTGTANGIGLLAGDVNISRNYYGKGINLIGITGETSTAAPAVGTIIGGNGGAGTGGTSGGAGSGMTITLGNGGSAAVPGYGGAGGNFSLTTGNGATGVLGGAGGQITILAGSGASGLALGASGGAIKITSGSGAGGAGPAGKGGDLNFISGSGGTSSSAVGGQGGDFVLSAGNAGNGAMAGANGGSAYFLSGLGSGTGIAGNIVIGASVAGVNRGTILIGNATANGLSTSDLNAVAKINSLDLRIRNDANILGKVTIGTATVIGLVSGDLNASGKIYTKDLNATNNIKADQNISVGAVLHGMIDWINVPISISLTGTAACDNLDAKITNYTYTCQTCIDSLAGTTIACGTIASVMENCACKVD